MSSNFQRSGASFRDPSGFMFWREGQLYRQVNQIYQQQYDTLLASGLYQRLLKEGLLIPHEEVQVDPAEPSQAYRVIQPETVRFISYPYEWSFSQLKDVASAALAIQRLAIEYGMTLKDASAYNLQFHQGRPLLVDTLSFDIYQEGEPWVAYRQFCQHFLAPLALMARRDVRLSQLLRVYLDGIPLNLASSLLPWITRFNLGLNLHIHLHAAAQQRFAGKIPQQAGPKQKMSRTAFVGLIDNLQTTVAGQTWQPAGTEWGAYYSQNAQHYSEEALEHKRQIVDRFLAQVCPASAWDLGANTGMFSRSASSLGIPTVAWDIDPAAVEQNYRQCKGKNEHNLLPLLIDLTNPSPALGWQNQERMSLLERGPVDVVLALALIHHLAISNNTPLTRIADFLRAAGRWLIIEFVPKEDPQVQILLSTRQDIFPAYHMEGFRQAFERVYHIHAAVSVSGTARILFLMEGR